MKQLTSVLIFLLLLDSAAQADVAYPDRQAPYQTIKSFVIDCLDSNGKAVPISSGLCDNGLAVTDPSNAAFSGVVSMTAGQVYTAQRSVGILATVAGNLTFTFTDSSTITLPVYIGWQSFPFAVTSFTIPGSGGATASVYNLK